MTFGNLIPLVLAYKYPQIVAIGYRSWCLAFRWWFALYVVSAKPSGASWLLIPKCCPKKKVKSYIFEITKPVLIYGNASDIFIMYMILTSENPNFIKFSSEFKNIFKKTILRRSFLDDWRDWWCKLSSLFAFKGQEEDKRRLGGSLYEIT